MKFICVLLNLVVYLSYGFNIVCVTRDSKIPAYGEINKEETCLVFAEIAQCISNNKSNEIQSVLEQLLTGSSLRQDILSIYMESEKQNKQKI